MSIVVYYKDELSADKATYSLHYLNNQCTSSEPARRRQRKLFVSKDRQVALAAVGQTINQDEVETFVMRFKHAVLKMRKEDTNEVEFDDGRDRKNTEDRTFIFMTREGTYITINEKLYRRRQDEVLGSGSGWSAMQVLVTGGMDRAAAHYALASITPMCSADYNTVLRKELAVLRLPKVIE